MCAPVLQRDDLKVGQRVGVDEPCHGVLRSDSALRRTYMPCIEHMDLHASFDGTINRQDVWLYSSGVRCTYQSITRQINARMMVLQGFTIQVNTNGVERARTPPLPKSRLTGPLLTYVPLSRDVPRHCFLNTGQVRSAWHQEVSMTSGGILVLAFHAGRKIWAGAP